MHDIGVNASNDTGLDCDCGHRCTDLADWHAHTARTYNNPSESAIQLRGPRFHTVVTVEPGRSAVITACTKIACAAQGNNAECWKLEMDGYPKLFGLPSRQIAEDLAVRGGVLSRTYELSTC